MKLLTFLSIASTLAWASAAIGLEGHSHETRAICRGDECNCSCDIICAQCCGCSSCTCRRDEMNVFKRAGDDTTNPEGISLRRSQRGHIAELTGGMDHITLDHYLKIRGAEAQSEEMVRGYVKRFNMYDLNQDGILTRDEVEE